MHYYLLREKSTVPLNCRWRNLNSDHLYKEWTIIRFIKKINFTIVDDASYNWICHTER